MRLLLLLLGAAALGQAQDERDDPALGQDIDAAGVCPTGHQLLWTLSASLREISEAVLGMREQVAALEHDVNGLLGVEGDATLQIRAPPNGPERFVLALTEQAVELDALARGVAGQLIVAQDDAATAFRALSGDAEMDADGVLDLVPGAVTLDEIEQLGEAELIIGTPCERVFGTTTCTNNNTRATLSGDVRLSADGEVRVLPNVLQLSQITRGGSGQLIVGQGSDGDAAYKTMLGDAELLNSGALLLREDVVTDYHIAAGSVKAEHLGRESVGVDALAPECVTREKMADNSVDTDAILDGSVTSQDLADDSITTEKLAPHPDGVDGEGQLFMYGADGRLERTLVRNDASLMAGGILTIQNAAISSAKLADGAVTAAKLAENSVTESALADFSVTYDKLRLTEGFPPFVKSGPVGGHVNVVTMTNTARSLDMIGTEGRLLFQQYYRGAVDEMSQEADAGAVGIAAETNWGPSAASRDAYIALHAASGGVMEERARFGRAATRLGPALDTQGSDDAAYRLEVGGATTLTAKCGACGDGGALRLANAETQASGSLVHLAGTTGQAALVVAAGDVEVAEGLSVGGALSVAALAPTEIVAPGTAGGALTLRSAGAQSSGDLCVLEGSAGQSALRVSAGDTALGGALAVSGAAALTELPGGTAVLSVSSAAVTLAKPLRTSELIEASAGLELGGALDASGGDGLVLSLPAAASALTIGASGAEPLITVDTTAGTVSVASVQASELAALDGQLDLSASAAGVLKVAVNSPTALRVRSEVLGIVKDYLTVDAEEDVVGVTALRTESLRLAVEEVVASDAIVIPAKAVVRVLPDDEDPATVTANWFTLQTPPEAGHTLLLSNHADAALRDSNGRLQDLPSGYAAQYVFLGSGTWMQFSSQPVPEDSRLLAPVDPAPGG